MDTSDQAMSAFALGFVGQCLGAVDLASVCYAVGALMMAYALWRGFHGQD